MNMRLIGRAVLGGAVVALILSGAGRPRAALADEGGQAYSAVAIASGFHTEYGIHGFLIVEKYLDGGGPASQATLDSLGTSRSFASLPYPGGKLLEHIAPTLPANPTSADILTALYALNGETLGGLLPPTTFIPGQPSDTNPCAVPVKVVKGRFVTANGDNYSCAPGWKPVTK